MKHILSFLFIISVNTVFAQIDLDSVARSIEEEANVLYKSEMASWYGTDLFLENFSEKRDKTGGYFSYSHSDKTTCIFFSKDETPRVIASFTFDGYSFNVKQATISDEERVFSGIENEVYTIRKKAFELINSDTLFKA